MFNGVSSSIFCRLALCLPKVVLEVECPQRCQVERRRFYRIWFLLFGFV
jgi:hypothetical protein